MMKRLLPALALAAATLASPLAAETSVALTQNPGNCTSGDICVADSDLNGGSTSSSCRICGWDLSSSENDVTNLSNYVYPGPGTGCASKNVNNTAESSRNRMSGTQRAACYTDGFNRGLPLLFIDPYSSVVTWRDMPGNVDNRASSIWLHPSSCP